MEREVQNRMPVLFLGHGSPMHAISDSPHRREWQRLGRELPLPRAILCVSAHWQTRGVCVTGNQKPETIHDFYGFPKELYQVRYPAPGSPELAARVRQLLKHESVQLDAERGLDHGAWSVLSAMYPQAQVPVVQLSLDIRREPQAHYDLGGRLSELREEGVLVLASGNIVHNLSLWRPNETRPYGWAQRFDQTVRDLIRARNHKDLVSYWKLGPEAKQSVPTPEHYLPLLYAMALQEPDDSLAFLNVEVTSAMSMTSVLFMAGKSDSEG